MRDTRVKATRRQRHKIARGVWYRNTRVSLGGGKRNIDWEKVISTSACDTEFQAAFAVVGINHINLPNQTVVATKVKSEVLKTKRMNNNKKKGARVRKRR
jgi:hypothetical protein